MAFTPCNLPMGADGDPAAFFSKVTGFGYNDMISLPTLTKESILENLKRRFKVRGCLRSARAPVHPRTPTNERAARRSLRLCTPTSATLSFQSTRSRTPAASARCGASRGHLFGVM